MSPFAAVTRCATALCLLPAWLSSAAVGQRQDPQVPVDMSLSAAYGIAVDSIHGGPLVNAIVRLEEIGYETATDDKGYYRITNVPPGTYRVVLYHPLLDTLGLSLRSNPIEFPVGRAPVIPLGVPSDTTVLDMVCPKVVNAAGPAALIGVVRDPDTDVPAAGADVFLQWTEVHVDQSNGIRTIERSRTVTADSAGNYAFCGIPMDMGAIVRARYKGVSTASVDVRIRNNSLVTLRSLSLGASTPVNDSAGAKHGLRRGPATLRGHVRNANGEPIVGARVEVLGAPGFVLSNMSGAFMLADLSAGTQRVLVRAIGYASGTAIVELSDMQPFVVTVELEKNPQRVIPLEARVAALGLERVGFTGRQRIGIGRFLTRSDIEKRVPMRTIDMFRAIAGVQVTTDRVGNTAVRSTRAARDAAACTAAFVDRLPIVAVSAAQLVATLNITVQPDQVEALEIYQPNQVPGEFTQAGQRCLTLVIWTRMAVGETGPDVASDLP